MSWESSVKDYYDNWYEAKSPLRDIDWFNRQKERERLIKVQKELARLRAKRPATFNFPVSNCSKQGRKKKAK